MPAEATGRLVRWVAVQQLVQGSAGSPIALALITLHPADQLLTCVCLPGRRLQRCQL